MARWLRAITIVLVVFVLFSIYLYLRRGYYNDYIINKVFGSTSAILAGLTLLIGPLAHKNKFFARFITIRRELGLLALAAALIHVFYSVYVLSDRFPYSWFIQEITPITFGGIAIAIWIYIASISSNKSITRLGPDTWHWRQRICGHVAFIAVYLHLVLMKYQGWINWWQGKVKASPELTNPSYPPASTFVFLAMSAILIYKGLLVFRKNT